MNECQQMSSPFHRRALVTVRSQVLRYAVRNTYSEFSAVGYEKFTWPAHAGREPRADRAAITEVPALDTPSFIRDIHE